MRSFYLEQPGWLHRVPALPKLAALSILGTTLFLVEDVVPLAVALGLVALLYATLGRAAWRALGVFRWLLVVVILLAVLHALLGSWQTGVATALRLVSLTALGMALTLTTRFDELLDAAETVLAPLRPLGVPVERLALAFGLMIRFIETFFSQWQRLDDAHRARSGRAGGLRLLAPLTIQALAAADRVSDALAARLGR